MREKFLVKVGSNLVTYIYNVLVSYLLALTFDQELMGIIGLTHSLITFLIIMASFGLEFIYMQHNSDEDFDNYFSVFFLYRTITIIIAYTPLIIFTFFLETEPILQEFLFLTIIFDKLIKFIKIKHPNKYI